MKSQGQIPAHRWSSPAFLLLLLTLGGCGSVLVGTYGRFPPSPDLEIVMPAGAPSIAQAFRSLDPVHAPDPMGEHDGIDIVAPAGTPVMAAAGGRVVRSHLTMIRGHRIVVEHGRNGEGDIVRTEYVHLKERLVKEGDTVVRGGQVGELGMTGVTAGYPHLHFMVVLVDGNGAVEQARAVNPHLYWAGGEGVVTCFGDAGPLAGVPTTLTYPVPCGGEERR